jgi:hypothetical protein
MQTTELHQSLLYCVCFHTWLCKLYSTTTKTIIVCVRACQRTHRKHFQSDSQLWNRYTCILHCWPTTMYASNHCTHISLGIVLTLCHNSPQPWQLIHCSTWPGSFVWISLSIPCAPPKERHQRSGRRAVVLVSFRWRANHPPLPSILLTNVQALDNNVDELRARISFHRDIRDCNIVTPWSLYFVFSLYIWSGQGVTWVYVIVFSYWGL